MTTVRIMLSIVVGMDMLTAMPAIATASIPGNTTTPYLRAWRMGGIREVITIVTATAITTKRVRVGAAIRWMWMREIRLL